MRDSTKVVSAKADRPSGAGFPNLRLGALSVLDKLGMLRKCKFVPVETRLKFTSKGSQTQFGIIGSGVSKGVTAYVG